MAGRQAGIISGSLSRGFVCDLRRRVRVVVVGFVWLVCAWCLVLGVWEAGGCRIRKLIMDCTALQGGDSE